MTCQYPYQRDFIWISNDQFKETTKSAPVTTKSAPVITNSVSDSLSRVGLSINSKIFPAKFVSITPSTAQVIDPRGKAKFDLVYNGVINKTSSYLLPDNISIYPRIDSGEPNRVIYADAPTNTTTSILLHLTPLQQSGFWDWNLLIRELVAGTPPAIIAAVV